MALVFGLAFWRERRDADASSFQFEGLVRSIFGKLPTKEDNIVAVSGPVAGGIP